jgi:hypothetical protein
MTKLQIDKRSPDKKTLGIPDRNRNNDRDRSTTYFLIFISLIITTCSTIIISLLFDRYLSSSRTAENNQRQSDLAATSANLPVAAKTPVDLIQTALGNQVQITVTTVRRIASKPNEVNVEMQIEKLTDTKLAAETISVGSTMASNPETAEVYRATDFLRRSSGVVSITKLRRDKPVDAYVVLDIPQGVTTIDLFVDQTEPFRNVPIAPANFTNFTRVVSHTPATRMTTLRSATSNPMIQPNGLIRKALENQAQVQLISAQRLNNPELPTRNVVNVKMRIWRLGTKQPNFQDVITVSATTARNPDTSETYRAFDFLNRATNPVFLFYLRPQTYTDAYVWLQVPEEVNTLDIFVPETGTFRNVPISRK